VFLVNSRLGPLAATASRSRGEPVHAAAVPLLPKLRGQFAEFLDGGSPVHLGMLYQPTCVGLRYGRATSWLEAFLDSAGSIRAAWGEPRAFPSPLGHRPRGFAYGASLPAWRARAPGPTPLRPPVARRGRPRDGTSNPLSIAYASPPRLRPASPAVDQHGCGTLGHPVGGILAPLALLMPTFALPAAPGSLPLPLHRRTGRSPTTRLAAHPRLRRRA
jgi:hypothetical protein